MFDVLTIAPEAASHAVIQSAIYRCSSDLGLTFRALGDGTHIYSSRELTTQELEELLRHVNDYSLRELVFERTQNYRDAILGAALIRLTSQQDDL